MVMYVVSECIVIKARHEPREQVNRDLLAPVKISWAVSSRCSQVVALQL
jgi:hypothetical protein